ncbi:TetR/AcrR family transcriptional regulator C-terminal domain-containing protein [Amycolatopsis rhabdoformis]|uniref:TetR/AcrR family transcriptional regulator C-terminal domain-containing protein n=1 Tax=Amycolatopsis rhabdoformis TaxID=1448059 RepID=A0ABZ1HYD1_9PSEU|nr:TetR/AcrR family transcriptional regulator C-terminal domain-containing protein [Amycolatopsis rhabdoformis]WSE26395.1 TetR/AcrR family transcriptional regulator C-terminal domain-containing protein [Amycolatopsis rhabdoformis]
MTAPRSRRERPAKPALTRAGIISAALAILRAEGLARLTMRRLAQELDTGAASLYVYVRNTVELHAAVLDELLGEVEPPPSAGSWEQRLEAVLGSYTAVLFRYPGLAQSALVARPRGDHYLRLVDTLLALLAEGDVPRSQAAWGVDLLLQVATATAAEHADERPEDSDEWQALAAVIRTASPEKYPHLAASGPELLSGAPGERMSWAFRALIAGIAHTPRT